jgi:hypothetical protein
MGFLERVLPGRRTSSAPRHAALGQWQDQMQDQEPPGARLPLPPPPPARPAPRTDLTQLLGRSIADPFALQICREYDLAPALGAGPARSYQSPAFGVSLLADDPGTVTMIFLHFHGDAGFEPYPGVIPGRGGTIAKRSSLWVALGRPDQSTDPHRDSAGEYGPSDQWRFPTFTMHALYALDNENLLRLTLRH